MGRKSKLTYDKVCFAFKLRELGYSIENIAKEIGIDDKTFYVKGSGWATIRAELNAIKAKAEAEQAAKIKQALVKRAIGYSVKETVKTIDRDGNVIGTQIKTKHIPADVKAQTLFLTNKCPDEFRINPDGQKIEENTDRTINIKIVDENE